MMIIKAQTPEHPRKGGKGTVLVSPTQLRCFTGRLASHLKYLLEISVRLYTFT